MHGLGNDFVIVDARGRADPITPALARAIGDRHRGVGYDQLAVIGTEPGVDATITFYNSDGSTAGACGNATRCVARVLFEENARSPVSLKTERGVLTVEKAENDLFRVNMGAPQLEWQDIPLAEAMETISLPIEGAPGAVGMGNPHMVFAVTDAEAVDLPVVGPALEHHPLFPAKTNVEFCEVVDRQTIRMRVWERGTGITLACGSGACAAAVALHRKGLTDRAVTIHLDGGPLYIDWQETGVLMTGPAAHAFSGTLSPELIP